MDVHEYAMLRVLYACALREVRAAYATKGSQHERCASMCVHRRNRLPDKLDGFELK